MSHFETAQLTLACRGRGEDRVAVLHGEDRTVIVVADGAGGTGGGDVAAEAVIREVQAAYSRVMTPEEWEGVLSQIDCRMVAGESTGVVVDLRPDAVLGASVGDSHAWIVNGGEILDLTIHQERKPLLGSGEARPRGFSGGEMLGRLRRAQPPPCKPKRGGNNYAKQRPGAVAQEEVNARSKTIRDRPSDKN